MKLTRNADPDKYRYSGYGYVFDAGLQISLSNGEWSKTLLFLDLILVFLCMLMIEKNDILVPGEGPADRLDYATITTEAKYSINITKLTNNIC